MHALREDGRAAKLAGAYPIIAVDLHDHKLAKARELGAAPNASVVRYLRHYHFGKLLQFLGESRAPKIQIDLPGKRTALEPGRVYLLPPFFAP